MRRVGRSDPTREAQVCSRGAVPPCTARPVPPCGAGRQGPATHPSVGLAPPPALVAAHAAVDLHHVAFPQRELPHVPGRKVVPGHRRADDTGREHCGGRRGRHAAATCCGAVQPGSRAGGRAVLLVRGATTGRSAPLGTGRGVLPGTGADAGAQAVTAPARPSRARRTGVTWPVGGWAVLALTVSGMGLQSMAASPVSPVPDLQTDWKPGRTGSGWDPGVNAQVTTTMENGDTRSAWGGLWRCRAVRSGPPRPCPPAARSHDQSGACRLHSKLPLRVAAWLLAATRGKALSEQQRTVADRQGSGRRGERAG